MIKNQPRMYTTGGITITNGQITIHIQNMKRKEAGGIVSTHRRPIIHITKDMRIGIQSIIILQPILGNILQGFMSFM